MQAASPPPQHQQPLGIEVVAEGCSLQRRRRQDRRCARQPRTSAFIAFNSSAINALLVGPTSSAECSLCAGSVGAERPIWLTQKTQSSRPRAATG